MARLNSLSVPTQCIDNLIGHCRDCWKLRKRGRIRPASQPNSQATPPNKKNEANKYLCFHQIVNKRTRESFKKAIHYFQAALANWRPVQGKRLAGSSRAL